MIYIVIPTCPAVPKTFRNVQGRIRKCSSWGILAHHGSCLAASCAVATPGSGLFDLPAPPLVPEPGTWVGVSADVPQSLPGKPVGIWKSNTVVGSSRLSGRLRLRVPKTPVECVRPVQYEVQWYYQSLSTAFLRCVTSQGALPIDP